MTRVVSKPDERFQGGADKYAAYLETPEGRLRTDLAFANLQEFLPQSGAASLHALDLGCGNGAAGLRLARLGVHVTLFDSSPAMLEIAKRSAEEAGAMEKIALVQDDVAHIADIFPPGSFDIILCHNLLEYVDDPSTVLNGVARAMRDSGILSLLVRSQAGEVLKAALKEGDLATAGGALDSDWGHESLYGGKVRLFTAKTVEAMLDEQPLTVTARRGVRAVADYLPAAISRVENYDQIFALERRLSMRREFFAIARYLQYLAGPMGSASGSGE